ncbi:hypothetical protein N2152v2_004136 [Parachlorella kessleri]
MEHAPAAKKQRLDADGAAASVAAATQDANGGKPAKGPSRTRKVLSPQGQVRLDIQMAARDGDIDKALHVYDTAKAGGLKISQDSYCTLLYLCSLGEDWEAAVPKGSSGLDLVARRSSSSASPAEDQSADGIASAAAPVAAAPGSQNGASGSVGEQPSTAAPAAETVAAVAAAAAGVEALEAEAGSSATAPTKQLDNNEPAAAAAAAAATSPSLDPEAVMTRGRQIFEEFREGAKEPPEMCYTALARMAAIAGDPAAAFQIVKDMQAAGVAAKLRSFTPALVGFAERGEFAAAAEVDAAIAACDLDLTEAEYARLIQAAAAPLPGGACWQQVRSVLLRMGRELTTLSRPTLEAVALLFGTEQAQQAFEPEGEQQQHQQQQEHSQQPSGQQAERQPQQPPHWEVGECRVSASGEVSPACGGRMRAVDLDQEDWSAFQEGIAALAEKQEKRANEFQKYMEWLERHGPFGAVVDGANVALYGQNFEHGGFTFSQIR